MEITGVRLVPNSAAMANASKSAQKVNTPMAMEDVRNVKKTRFRTITK